MKSGLQQLGLQFIRMACLPNLSSAGELKGSDITRGGLLEWAEKSVPRATASKRRLDRP